MRGSEVRRQRRGPSPVLPFGKYEGFRRNRQQNGRYISCLKRSKKRTMYNSFHTARARGSGRIEDACGESPAASLDGVFSMRLRFIIRTLCGHYANRSIQERHYGFLGRFLGLWGGVGGIWEGPGSVLESSWEVLGWSWGVLGRSWGGPGEVLGDLVAILGRHFEHSNFRLIF